MLMPNAQKCVVPQRKVVDYLLSFDHPDGRAKARFFAQYGFSRENWQRLADALRAHSCHSPVSNTVQSEYGMKYIIDGSLISPNGRVISIRSIWIVDNDDPAAHPMLVTAYPL